ncbi:hypothetical protein ACOMHN_023157 [Nucella lapillus]
MAALAGREHIRTTSPLYTVHDDAFFSPEPDAVAVAGAGAAPQPHMWLVSLPCPGLTPGLSAPDSYTGGPQPLGSDCVVTAVRSRHVWKSQTMLGSDGSPQTLGVMPCAIAWLFKLINEQKDKTGARFSVRVSAVEVSGKNENLRDLLTDIAQGHTSESLGLTESGSRVF